MGHPVLMFLDFKASSLGKQGFSVEVSWAAEDGTGKGNLVRPVPGCGADETSAWNDA